MDNMPIVVGTEDCPIGAIHELLWKDTIIGENWSQFARGLGIPSDRIKKFSKDMLLDKLSHADVVFEILEMWVAQEGSGATLGGLLQVVEEPLRGDGVGEKLRLRLDLPCKSAASNPSIEWEELTPAFQKQVRDHFQNFFPAVEFAQALPKLKGPMLIDLMTGKKPPLIFHKPSIPDRPAYYINRTLITRNIISGDIFDHNTPDIFLFKGMDRSELSKLAKDKLTGDSREQLQCKDIKPRFLILNQDNHFGKICGKTSKPVHWLRKQTDGRLRWIRSNGNMAYLQNCVDQSQSQDELDEEMFCKSLASQKTPVCISDSPGMGKSLLLAVIGNRLTQMYPERIVHFIELREFMKSVKLAEDDDKVKSIRKVLSSLFGVDVVQSGPESEKDEVESLSTELLLDGFDELDSSDHQCAYDIFKAIQTHFRSIRVWVTSRPHLLNELERQLNQLGFKIRPFLVDDQAHFLSSYWSRKKPLDQERCQQFARRCLAALKSKMNSGDQDIAGIPMQCLLIGESYEEDAVEFARMDREDELQAEVEVEISTITNLYGSLIEKKIRKFKAIAGETTSSEFDLLTIHAQLSLETIFPDHLEQLRLGSSPIGEGQLEQVLRIGILESSSTAQSPRFMHRTFAEYFVAWFVSNGMQDDNSLEGEWSRVFSLTLASHNQVEMGLDSFTFVYPVITYFIDSLIPSIPPIQNPSAIQLDADSIRQIVHSCVNANYIHLFHLFLKLDIIDSSSNSLFQDEVLQLSIWNSDLELVKTVVEIFEHQDRFDSHSYIFSIPVNALRAAIKRGKFSILEYLLKEKQISQLVLGFDERAPDLIHACVENSKNDNEGEIEQKLHILRTLVGIRPIFLLEKGGLWKLEPLLSHGAHVALLKELISLGAPVSTLGIGSCSILHLDQSRNHLSNKDYHELLICIPEESLAGLVQWKGEDKDTPLMTILRWFDPLPETLRIFKNAGASFKLSDANQNSILEIAIKNGRSSTTTSLIMEYGGSIPWRPLKGVTDFLGRSNRGTKRLLHHAAISGNLVATKLLLEDKRLDLNVEDEHGLTPLDYAIMGDSPDGSYFEVGLLLLQGGGTVTNNVNFQGHSTQRLLYKAVKNRELRFAQLLIQHGVDVNMINEKGNTALHMVVSNGMGWRKSTDNFYIATSLLDNKANPKIGPIVQHPWYVARRDIDNELSLLLDDNVLKSSNLAIELLIKLAVLPAELDDEEQLERLTREFVTCLGDINYQNSNGNTILHIMAMNGFMNFLNVLSSSPGANLNIKNNQGRTVLHEATTCRSEKSKLGVIKLLIEKGADIHTTDLDHDSVLSTFISTSPTLSQFHNFLELLTPKTTIDSPKTLDGKLDAAICLNDEVRTLSLLHSNHTDFNLANASDNVLLFHAVLSSLIDQFGMDPKHLNKFNESLLHISAKHHSSDVLKLFLDLKILEVNALTTDGDTPLHLALQPYHLSEAVQSCTHLMEHGADPNILNEQGQTPMALAKELYEESEDDDDDIKQELFSLLRATLSDIDDGEL